MDYGLEDGSDWMRTSIDESVYAEDDDDLASYLETRRFLKMAQEKYQLDNSNEYLIQWIEEVIGWLEFYLEKAKLKQSREETWGTGSIRIEDEEEEDE